ncbi:MAG: GntR family transcriptional regulator, partial [Planctomycetes bacterium]|nr:GntR family transcriptional regulator [Planctomycetota bacterium]
MDGFALAIGAAELAAGTALPVVGESLAGKPFDGALQPGQWIDEKALAAQWQASRTPLREALNRLVAEGFLTFQTGKG